MKNLSTYAEFIETELIIDNKPVIFNITLSDKINKADSSLVLDLYDLNNPTHPEGHLGWWKFALDSDMHAINGTLDLATPVISLNNQMPAIDSWTNPEKLNAKQYVLIAVLRSNTSNAILHMDKIPVFLSAKDHEHYRTQRFDEFKTMERFATSWFLPDANGTVRIACHNIFAKDAVGQFCFDIYQLCQQNNIPVELYAENFDLGLNTLIKRESNILKDTTSNDTIIYFHSTYDAFLPEIANLKAKNKIAYFHGITQPKLLRVFDIELSMICEKAFNQLPILKEFNTIAANSHATANTLKKHVPDLIDFPIDIVAPKLIAHHTHETTKKISTTPTKLLYVGRIKSHKKIEDLLMLFAEYLKLDPKAECMIVGGTADKPYMDYLNWLQNEHLKSHQQKITWMGQVTQDGLKDAYHNASAYISMSEDEGFCIPLIEAMMANTPVFGYGIPAVKEILNEAGVYFTHKDFPVLAQQLHDTLINAKHQAAIIDKQQQRINELLPMMDGRAILRWLTQ